MKFLVDVTFSSDVEVDAGSLEEALEQAEHQMDEYINGGVCHAGSFEYSVALENMPDESESKPSADDEQDDCSCPRCGGDVPNTAYKGQYPGAVSRVDNETEVCSRCGVEEAMLEIKGRLNGMKTWWINRKAESRK